VVPCDAVTRFRWVILSLVFLGTTLNYIDRLVMGILASDLQALYAISNIQYGYIQSAFALAYALGQSVAGGWLDRVGTRFGYACALAAWSASSMVHALARGPIGFGLVRGLLGVSESPAFPAAVKTLAEWFPQRERALAFGFVNAGTNMGAIIAPIVVPWLALTYGWQWAFIGTGALGFVSLLLWVPLYRSPQVHPRVSPAELAVIEADQIAPAARLPWLKVMAYPQAWAFAGSKTLTDSMWWFYMTWIPKFLHDRHGLDLVHIGLPLVAIYVMADIGSVAGGYLSSTMLVRGYSVNRARKTTLLLCALGVVPIVFAQSVSTVWSAVLLLGLATASHQGFSTNQYTLVSDMFPKEAVGAASGLGGTCGFLGASTFQIVVGHLVSGSQPNYFVPFLCAGLAYLVALAIIQVSAPTMARVVIPTA
jgi:MFS transporter, ACS family, hexuronate transporter